MTDDPRNLDKLISEVLDAHQEDPFFRPWSKRLSKRSRQVHYEDVMLSLGPRYAECSFTNFNVYEETTNENRPSQRQVLDQIQAFAAEAPNRLAQGGGVVLFGKPGTGKDHLLCALAFWVILHYGFTVRWTGGPELYQRARDRIREDTEAERKMIKEYCETQILIISDPVPARGSISQYSADIVQRIIDRRYRGLLSTWATMNVHDGAEAEQRLASPIVDRLRHHALCLDCNWSSFRARDGADRRRER
ncbi:hypothetical protein LCGC14_1156040 [marine sediment metagenome]|uniref:IstB-like ATP-binding domain-containing protein n=1 Tax=marine sediment metagenome TaxID=412755 RepID=A0A0F9MH49_9ZZZZ